MKALGLADLAATNAELGGEVEEAVLRVVRSGRYVGGPEVEAFERAFAQYLNVAHAVAVGNGTDALKLALKAVGVGPGTEVLLPANTFIATAEAVADAGALPRFVDVEPDSGLMSLESAAERLTAQTRVIIPVHLYGRMVEMEPVLEFARANQIMVVEDAAQAHGAQRKGRCAGTLGSAGCFSFFPGKNLGAIGDAGAVVTHDAEIADRLRLLRDHGRRTRDEHESPGLNSRMDPIQAAVLSAKLPYLERWNAARREVAAQSRAHLSPVLDCPGGYSEAEVHHIFPILVAERDVLADRLRDAGIGTGVHYRQPLPRTKAFASSDHCPVAEQRSDAQLSLPIHPHLGDDDITRIIDRVLAWSRRAVAVN